MNSCRRRMGWSLPLWLAVVCVVGCGEDLLVSGADATSDIKKPHGNGNDIHVATDGAEGDGAQIDAGDAVDTGDGDTGDDADATTDTTPIGCTAAQKAAPETCNGQDDNCNGLTDEAASGVSLCDDGNPCTEGDTCAQGKCTSTENTCECKSDGDCAAKDDKDLCNGKLFCDKSGAKAACKVKPESVVVCSSGTGAACSGSVCNPDTGTCATKPLAEGSGCDADGNLCTQNDVCQGGTCKPGAVDTCDDKNPCTGDSCDAKLGCVHTANTAACDDGSVCTTGDACKDKVCAAAGTKNCDDNNPCTVDVCDKGSGTCTHDGKGANGQPCSGGGDVCTGGGACQDGTCKPGQAKGCDDGNLCTTDSCDGKTGCVHVPNSAPCEDGNTCTKSDACAGGSCKGGADSCDCKTDADCAGKATDKCQGALFCDTAGASPACKLKAGTGVTCPAAGDGSCGQNACDPASGLCAVKSINDGKGCDDGNACTVGDVCGGGACKPGAASACNDGNACTNDACDPKLGCVQTANTAPCDADGNACTAGDVCKDKACVPGAAKACADNSPCTVDACDKVSGQCAFDGAPLAGKPCDDGNVCSVNDACQGGACKSGTASGCDDNNPCTTDTCDAGTGCKYTPGNGACDDGNACTTGDTCGASGCTGAAKNCDDSNPCTADACSAGTCTHAAKSCVTTFQLAYGGEANDDFTQVREVAGGYVVAGQTASKGAGNGDGLVMKLGSCGTVVWGFTYGGSGKDSLNWVEPTPDGGYLVTGQSASWDAAGDIWVLKLDASGKKVWSVTHGGSGLDIGQSVVPTSDGGAVVAAKTFSFGPGTPTLHNGLLLKLSASGAVQWSKVLASDTGSMDSVKIREVSGGYVLIGGSEGYGSGADDVWITKLGSDGGHMWSVAHGGPADDDPVGFVVGGDGSLTITGTTKGFGAAATDVFVMRADSAGKLQWFHRFGSPGKDEAAGITAVSGGFVVSGFTTGWGAAGSDAFALKVTAGGDVTWLRVYGGSGTDFGVGIGATQDGGVVIAGRTTSAGKGANDAWLIKAGPDGAVGCQDKTAAVSAVPQTTVVSKPFTPVQLNAGQKAAEASVAADAGLSNAVTAICPCK